MIRTGVIAATALALAAAPGTAQQARAQQKTVKIGFVSTFSGPTAAIGNDMRNAFELGLDHLGRKIGGLPVEIIYEDDTQKPDVGVQKTQKLIESDKVDFIVGYIWSNVLLASLKPLGRLKDHHGRGKCRRLASFRRTVLALRFLDVMEQRPDARGDGPVYEPKRDQEGLSDRSQLCGRQGHASRHAQYI